MATVRKVGAPAFHVAPIRSRYARRYASRYARRYARLSIFCVLRLAPKFCTTRILRRHVVYDRRGGVGMPLLKFVFAPSVEHALGHGGRDLAWRHDALTKRADTHTYLISGPLPSLSP